MPNYTITGGPLDEDEAAAALAAVACLLELEAEVSSAAAQAEPAPPAGWRDSARLLAQGITPTRLPAAPRWNSIERLRRAIRSGSGVVGQ